MTTTPTPDAGSFVWHDLMTTDRDKASVFYSELLGWQLSEMPVGPHTYHMIQAGGRGIGGIRTLDGSENPSHWIAYVSVADTDAGYAKAKTLGATVCVEPTDIPEVGRFAVVKDPQGAVISLFRSAEPQQLLDPAQTKPGQVCWNELWTSDAEAANRFYGELFGWQVEKMDMGEAGTYWLQKLGDVQHGGIMKAPMPEAPPYWCPYFLVETVDEHTTRATELGGQVCVPCQDIPNVGRFSVAIDPTGAAFSLFEGAKTDC